MCKLIDWSSFQHVIAADLDDHAVAVIGDLRKLWNLVCQSTGSVVGWLCQVGRRHASFARESIRPRYDLAKASGRKRITDDEKSRRNGDMGRGQMVGNFQRDCDETESDRGTGHDPESSRPEAHHRIR